MTRAIDPPSDDANDVAPLSLDAGPLHDALAAVRDAILGIERAKDALADRRREFAATFAREVQRRAGSDSSALTEQLREAVRRLYWDHAELRLTDLTAATGLPSDTVRALAGPRTVEVACVGCAAATTALQTSRREPTRAKCPDCRGPEPDYGLTPPMIVDDAPGRPAPLPRFDAALMQRLVDHLARRVGADGCDNQLTHTRRWALREGIDVEPLVEYLQMRGGFCDCEVVLNVP